MTSRRGTTNRNDRGSSHDRAIRRQWILDHFGDGIHVACRYCWMTLIKATLTIDRLTPGCDGGRYTRDNIGPACAPCQSRQGGKLAHRRRAVAQAGGCP